MNLKPLFLAVLLLGAAQAPATTIRIGVGTQDATINCVTGGGVVRYKHLLEKYLPHTGKYKGVTYDIVWHDFTSGAPINTELLAGKLDLAVMADFPSIVGASSFLKQDNGVRTLWIADTMGGIKGAGNAVVVPLDSPIQSFDQLKGKRISVPFASTAHAMLLRAVQVQGWDPDRDVQILTQSPEVAGSALKADQIEAHADFVPYGELFPFRGIARKIYDGSQSGVPTVHGIQVRSDFAAQYPELVVAYLKATLEADRLFRKEPVKLSEDVARWTGVDAEVVYAFHGPEGIQIRDYSLKPEYIEAIRRAELTLHVLKKTAVRVDIGSYVTDRYIRQAAEEFGLNYDRQLKDYRPVPFEGNAEDTGRPVPNYKLAGQVWVRGEERVRLYSTVKAALKASEKLRGQGRSIRVVYAQDRVSGNKLFADKSWYVSAKGRLSAFLLKTTAQDWAAKHGGTVRTYAEVEQALKAGPAAKDRG